MRKRLDMEHRFEIASKVINKTPLKQITHEYGVNTTYIIRLNRDLIPFIKLVTEESFSEEIPTYKRSLAPARHPSAKEHYQELNYLTKMFFRKLMAAKCEMSETKLKMMALAVAKKLGISGFKASNGWLESFKKRNNIAKHKIDHTTHKLLFAPLPPQKLPRETHCQPTQKYAVPPAPPTPPPPKGVGYSAIYAKNSTPYLLRSRSQPAAGKNVAVRNVIKEEAAGNDEVAAEKGLKNISQVYYSLLQLERNIRRHMPELEKRFVLFKRDFEAFVTGSK